MAAYGRHRKKSHFGDRLRGTDPGLELEFEFEQPPLDWFPPTEVPANHPLVESLLSASEGLSFWLNFPNSGRIISWQQAVAHTRPHVYAAAIAESLRRWRSC